MIGVWARAIVLIIPLLLVIYLALEPALDALGVTDDFWRSVAGFCTGLVAWFVAFFGALVWEEARS